MSKKRLNASAAVTTVLVLGSVATIISAFMLLQSTDNIVLTKTLREGKQAEHAAYACSEVALAKLRENQTYSGNETIVLSADESCSIDAVVTIPLGEYTITTHSIIGNSTKSFEVHVSAIDSQVHVSSWKEISN